MPNPMNKHVAKLRQFTGGRVPFSVSLEESVISVLFVESQGLEGEQWARSELDGYGSIRQRNKSPFIQSRLSWELGLPLSSCLAFPTATTGIHRCLNDTAESKAGMPQASKAGVGEVAELLDASWSRSVNLWESPPFIARER